MSEQFNPQTPQVHYHLPAAPAAPQWNNGFCTTAMVLGLCTFITFGFTAIPAVVFGALGLKQVERGEANARGQAVAGLVLGIIACLGWIGYWFLILIVAGSGA